MPRHVELNPYAVRPVSAHSGVGAKETRTGQPRFAELLAEAERVRDSVDVRGRTASDPASRTATGTRVVTAAAALAGTVAGIWQGLNLGPWMEHRVRRDEATKLNVPVAGEG